MNRRLKWPSIVPIMYLFQVVVVVNNVQRTKCFTPHSETHSFVSILTNFAFVKLLLTGDVSLVHPVMSLLFVKIPTTSFVPLGGMPIIFGGSLCLIWKRLRII